VSDVPLTLAHHLRARGDAEAADLAVVLTQLALAGKLIARELARAALVGQLGTTGETNVQGEAVKKLDVWSNDAVVSALEAAGLVCTLVSEEMAEPLHLDRHCGRARYVVCFDPVDGSSNLDINGIVGTIFSIRRRRAAGADHVKPDALQPGTAQVAAGYVMYGASTLLVYTAGDGVHGFTLDPTIGEFVRSHDQIRIPRRGKIYSANEGNSPRWEPGVRRYLDHLQTIGRAELVTGDEARAIAQGIHRRYLSAAALADPQVGPVFAAFDDVAIRLTPSQWLWWNMADVDAAYFGGKMSANPGYLLPLE